MESVASDNSFGNLNSESIQRGVNEDSEEDYEQNFSEEMSKLLQRFSNDMNKTRQAKRKKLEKFTQECTRLTTKKALEANENQTLERKKLIEAFKTQFFNLIQQGESELEKIKETEEKLQKLLVQQENQEQQVRISHSQRTKALIKVSEEFDKGMGELEENVVENFSAIYEELRKEIVLLPNKIFLEM